MANIVYTCDVHWGTGGFADRLYGLAATRMMAKRYDREFKIEYTKGLDFFDVFCPFLASQFRFSKATQNATIANLIDTRCTRDNLSVIDQWLRSNPDSDLRISINDLSSTLANHFNWAEFDERRVLKSFADDFLFPERGALRAVLEGYANILNKSQFVGVHFRTGIFGDSTIDGKPLVPSMENLLDQAQGLLRAAEGVFVASDNHDVKAGLVEAFGKELPVITFPAMASHLDRSEATMKDKIPPASASIIDWILLRMCKVGIIGTAGRYAQSAAFSSGKAFLRVHPS
jgi:hypothetical protein